MITINQIEDAARAIAPYVLRTPTIRSWGLTELIGVETTIKIECLQRTGSFKVRGATAKLLSLTDAERAAGVVAISGGNHGIAVATMAQLLSIPATVVMPKTAARDSIERSRAAGADLRLTEDMPEAFALGAELTACGATLLHPFDDPVVVAGQGTIGLEMAADAGDLTDVLVSVGGGGLISGIAVALKSRSPQIRVWGVEPTGARSMSDALAADGPVTTELDSVITTLSAPQVSELTFHHVHDLVEGIITVPDQDAAVGSLNIAERAGVWVEPADGILLPAAQSLAADIGPNARFGLVLAGSNASIARVSEWAREDRGQPA